jgi:hypothetical protein
LLSGYLDGAVKAILDPRSSILDPQQQFPFESIHLRLGEALVTAGDGGQSLVKQ